MRVHRAAAVNELAPMPGEPQGLFDPSLEKDSCGVGFIADIKARASHKIVQDALSILCNLEHRGAVGADPRAGDGAGILVQIPHKFFAAKADRLGFSLPKPGEYAVGALFMPRDRDWGQIIRDLWAQMIRREGMTLLGWREVPTDNSTLGESVKPTEPQHLQVFIGRGRKIKNEDEFERRLYILRKAISHAIYTRKDRKLAGYYPVSVSCRTVIYKGMFLADQLLTYYPDLHAPTFVSAMALVHQRFSTNTFPTWSLAHPYRMIAHNGEINTLRGNVNWMAARQASVSSPLLGDDINKLWPISYEGQSDTACSRISGAGRLLARACHDDDDSGSVGGQSAHGRGTAGLLRVQRCADGAVGRSRRDRLHRRTADRRHARSQRIAPGALFPHAGRPHHHGLRNGGAADPGARHRAEMAPAARQDAARRSR
jgi:glutamate synthase domain-containing protein 1